MKHGINFMEFIILKDLNSDLAVEESHDSSTAFPS
jgi:hypothetical protein